MLRGASIIAALLACLIGRADVFFDALEFPNAHVAIPSESPAKMGPFEKGVCLLRGISAEKNPTRAVENFATASFSGDERAKYAMALCMLEGVGTAKNQKGALELFRALERRDFAPASRALAYCYERGSGVEKNPTAAKAFYEKAFAYGSERGAVELARFCLENSLTPVDSKGLAEAVKKLSKKEEGTEFVEDR